jgi:SH3 domain protein
MNKGRFFLILSFALCLIGQTVWAVTAYVTDVFEVPLRTGPSLENKIISLPSSGTALEVLDTQGDWSHVRIMKRGGESLEGWIPSRYLVSRIPWELQAISLKNENVSLKEKLADAERKLDEALQREEELSRNLKGSSEDLKNLKSNYESLKKGATEYLRLEAAYKAARDRLDASQKSIQKLSVENETLRNSQRNRWFAIGALVLLCGLMIGLVVGRQQKKRKSLYT